MWQKIGKIFDPRDHASPNGCLEFAQAPQVLKFDDFIRVYFSTRHRDQSGKFISHIAFVDFDEYFKILRVASEPVIGLGRLGCYDEHGIFPLNVLRVDKKIFGYIGGWSRRVSVSIDGSIGLAWSFDEGMTFRRIGDGPVLTTSLNEPFLIGDPFVQRYKNTFHMWYIFGTRWARYVEGGVPERTYKIGHAISTDGVCWEKLHDGREIIESNLGLTESQALPTVIKISDRYHMYFCYRQSSSDFRTDKRRAYRIGYAFSDDLVTWVRDDSKVGIDVSDGDWDSDMLCYPHVFELAGDVFLLYNGNAFGKCGFGIAKLRR